MAAAVHNTSLVIFPARTGQFRSLAPFGRLYAPHNPKAKKTAETASRWNRYGVSPAARMAPLTPSSAIPRGPMQQMLAATLAMADPELPATVPIREATDFTPASPLFFAHTGSVPFYALGD